MDGRGGRLKKGLADCGGDKRPLLQCWVMEAGMRVGAGGRTVGCERYREMLADLAHD